MKCLYSLCLLLCLLVPVSAQDEPLIEEIARLGRGTINTMAWKPDGSLFVVGSGDGLWFYNESLQTLAHIGSGYVSLTEWSPDSRYLATVADTDGVCVTELWQIDSLDIDNSATHNTYECAGDVDWFNTKLAISSNDGQVRIVDVETRTLVSYFRIADEDSLPYYAAKLVWSPDGSQIATVFASDLRIWNAARGEMVSNFPDTNTVGWDGNFLEWQGDILRTVCLAVGDGGYAAGYVCDWDIQSKEIIRDSDVISGSVGFPIQIESVPEGLMYVHSMSARSIEPTVLILNTEGEVEIVGYGRAAARHPSEPIIAYGNGEGELFLYDIATGRIQNQQRLHTQEISDIAWHPTDGRLAVSGYGYSYPVTIWQMRGNGLFNDEPDELIEPEVAQWATWFANGNLLVLGGTTDGDTAVTDGELVLDGNTYENISANFTSFQYDPIIRHAYNSQHVEYLDYTSSHEGLIFPNDRSVLPKGERIYRVVWSPDDSMVATLSDTYNSTTETRSSFIEVWDTQTLDLIYSGDYAALSGIQWSPDSHKLLFLILYTNATMEPTSVNVLEVQSGEVSRLAASDNITFPYTSAWHPNSRYLVFGEQDSLTIYDAETGASVFTYPAYRLNALDWSKDGQYIAAGGADGIVRIFDVSRIVSNN